MNSFSFDTISSPVFLGGLAGSVIVLGVIRCLDFAAAKAEAEMNYDRTRRCYFTRLATRVRIGTTAVLSFGDANRARLWNPGFLLTEVGPREPMAIAPFTFAWLCVLFDEPGLAVQVAAFGLIWRGCVDYCRSFSELPRQLRVRSVLLKLVWAGATGVWLASVAYLVLAALVALMILLALAGGGASRKRRSR